MLLQTIDIVVILVYLAAMILLGILLKKRAQRDKESYLLGGKKLPWYMLGMSNASDMFDISGTMWLVTLCFESRHQVLPGVRRRINLLNREGK